MNHDSLLDDLASRPRDVAARLVYADWLEGSVGQVLYLTGKTFHFSAELAQLRSVAAGRIIDSLPVIQQIRPLVLCFRSGEYRVNGPFSSSFTRLEVPGRSRKPQLMEFYPYENLELVPSQHTDTLDQQRIAYWMARLDHQPIVFSVRDPEDWVSFVIDGHHKLEAYRRSQRDARLIEIQPLAKEDEDERFEDFWSGDAAAHRAFQRARARARR